MSDETPSPESTPQSEVESFDTETARVRSRSDEAIAESRENAIICAKIAEQYRGRDTVILDLTGITPIVDFFVISTGSTRRQMHAVAEEADRILKERGSKRVGLEGYRESNWILQDYGDVVLHVFTEDMRKLYDLERLWADAPRVEWEPDEAASEAAEEPSEASASGSEPTDHVGGPSEPTEATEQS